MCGTLVDLPSLSRNCVNTTGTPSGMCMYSTETKGNSIYEREVVKHPVYHLCEPLPVDVSLMSKTSDSGWK
jgi:hypothetical protein